MTLLSLLCGRTVEHNLRVYKKITKPKAQCNLLCLILAHKKLKRVEHSTVVQTKSDSDVIFCLQLLSTTLTC